MADEEKKKTVKIDKEITDEEMDTLKNDIKDFIQLILKSAGKDFDLSKLDLTDSMYKIIEQLGGDLEITLKNNDEVTIKGKTTGKSVTMDKDGNLSMHAEDRVGDKDTRPKEVDPVTLDDDKKKGEQPDISEDILDAIRKKYGRTNDGFNKRKTYNLGDLLGFGSFYNNGNRRFNNPYDMLGMMGNMSQGANPLPFMAGNMGFGGMMNPSMNGYMPGMFGGCCTPPMDFMSMYNNVNQVPFGNGYYNNYNMQQIMMMAQYMMAMQMMTMMNPWGIDFMSEFMAMPEVQKLFKEFMKTKGIPGSYLNNLQKMANGKNNTQDGSKFQDGFMKMFAEKFGTGELDREELLKALERESKQSLPVEKPMEQASEVYAEF